jgi:nucleotide-binding universal stress UspA family protein
MKTILVPTDFKNAAELAIDAAVRIAQPHHATIKLLTVIHFPKAQFRLIESAVYTEDEFQESLERDANREIERWQGWYPTAKIEGLVKNDEHQGLPFAITGEKADLIVMGSEGQNGWKDYFSGTNSQNVVRTAQCPVLVIKEGVSFPKLSKVLFVTDFLKTDFIKKAQHIFGFEHTENHFVFVDDSNFSFDVQEVMHNAQQVQKDYQIKNFHFQIYVADTIQKGIIDYANELEVDLIVLYTNGRQGIERFMMGSIAEEVLNHTQIAVLSIVE